MHSVDGVVQLHGKLHQTHSLLQKKSLHVLAILKLLNDLSGLGTAKKKAQPLQKQLIDCDPIKRLYSTQSAQTWLPSGSMTVSGLFYSIVFQKDLKVWVRMNKSSK